MTKSPSALLLLNAAEQAFRRGATDAARAQVAQACEVFPTALDAWLLRADIARALGDLPDLAFALARAAALTDDPRLRAVLDLDRGWALYGAGRTGQAFALAGALAPARLPAERLPIYGDLLEAVGLSDEAEQSFADAARMRPNDPAAWLRLAMAQNALGRSDAVIQTCERVLTLAPELAQAHALLASAAQAAISGHQVDRMERSRARADHPLDRARLGYAVFEARNAMGDVEAAWPALVDAGRAALSLFPWAAREEFLAQREFVSATSRAAAKASPKATGGPVPRPLFIVGMPRSGTTLVDRILAAHSQVRSLGELTTFGRLASGGRSSGGSYNDSASLKRAAAADWADVGRAYLTEVGLMARGRPVLTDKNPQNFVFAGAIAHALPQAVVVHVVRAPMDALFGAYRRFFVREHAWSNDLDSLADYYRHHLETAAVWRKHLGRRWVDVSYESLVREPGDVIPRLLDACGLDFEAQCLSPHLGVGAVRTLSALQVREPIHMKSLGAWRRYGEKLEPLRARLEAFGAVDARGEPTVG